MNINSILSTRVFYQASRILAVFLIVGTFGFVVYKSEDNFRAVLPSKNEAQYWFVLERKSNLELFYLGEAGNKDRSELIKTFKVKVGVPGEKPTPLPRLLGRDYWTIIDKRESFDNVETAPYFLTLDIPVTAEEPYGPEPYLECNGQCSWVLPGYFGLHGVNGNADKLSEADPGSSGCVRHSDEDIAYLYNLLDPSEEIRYYVEEI